MKTFMSSEENDFVVENGKFLVETDPLLCSAIKLKNRLQFHRGEWSFDTRQGFPWLSQVFGKAKDLATARQLILRTILDIEMFVSVPYLQLTLDRETRTLVIEFQIQAADGRVFSGSNVDGFFVSEGA